MIKRFFLLTIPSLLVFFLAFEIFLRLFVHVQEIPYAYFDSENQILKYDVTKQREGIHSLGKLCTNPTTWRVNNMGWMSDIDYQITGRTKPLIVVIGDSFIEGFHVNPNQNVVSLLRQKLGGAYDVYGFGFDGANLVQYLNMARYVDKTFHSDFFIFNIIHNDFGFPCRVDQRDGMLCLERDGDNWKEAPIKPYRPQPLKEIFHQSSFFRYLLLNVNLEQLDQTLPRLGRIFKMRKKRQISAVLPDYMRSGGDYVWHQISILAKGRRVLMVMDAPRLELYSEAPPVGTCFKRSELNHLAAELSEKYGFDHLDLIETFQNDFKKRGVRFEFPRDGHWNPEGHALAAAAILEKIKK